MEPQSFIFDREKQSFQISKKTVSAHHKHLLQAAVLYQEGAYQKAISPIDLFLQKEPFDFEGNHLRALVAHQLGDFDTAFKRFAQAISVKPLEPTAYYNFGLCLQKAKKYEHSVRLYEMALKLEKHNASMYNNYGVVLKELNRFDDAMRSYQQAITLDPNYPKTYVNRAGLLTRLNRLDEALQDCLKALELDAVYPEAWHNLGFIQGERQQHREALQAFGKVVELQPNNAGAHFAISLGHLKLGEFAEGWKSYEWRWQDETQNIKKPVIGGEEWDGSQPLKGNRILVYFEQGLGDTLQFCRFVPLLADLGAEVHFLVQPSLASLLRSLDERVHIHDGGQLPDMELHIPLLSLPYRLGLHAETDLITKPDYLHAGPESIETWQVPLAKLPRPRIGLAWSGNAIHKNDHNRSVPLANLLKALPCEYDYVILQKDVRPVDAELLAKQTSHQIHRLDIETFADTAAICHQLDLVISVDTSVCHLAGSLGTQTWVLTPINPDWRWMLERTDSPWYPHTLVWRQDTYGDWQPTLDRVGQALRTHFAGAELGE